jgi:hypothetical protein
LDAEVESISKKQVDNPVRELKDGIGSARVIGNPVGEIKRGADERPVSDAVGS